jgi:hypothetical protein
VNAADIRAYARRRWNLVEALKADFWAQEKQSLGPAGSLRIADGLRRHARLLHPGGQSEQERAEDLRSHDAVARKLRLVRPHRDR